jgi:molecular chaperone DnaK (HSP70)
MLGLDFGTTNSAIAVAPPGGVPRLATFGDDATFRSILHVDPEEPGDDGLPPRVTAGAGAFTAGSRPAAAAGSSSPSRRIWRAASSPRRASSGASTASKT